MGAKLERYNQQFLEEAQGDVSIGKRNINTICCCCFGFGFFLKDKKKYRTVDKGEASLYDTTRNLETEPVPEPQLPGPLPGWQGQGAVETEENAREHQK